MGLGMAPETIGIASDHAGFELKQSLKARLGTITPRGGGIGLP